MSTFPRLRGYRFSEYLGGSSRGSVHLAWDETLGRQVAIKTLSEKIEAGSVAEARFLREARAMATIEHPNVVRIYHFATEGGRAFIIMEYVEGETLAERLAERGPLPVDEALDIVRQVAEALEAAWEKGIIHRDVKPSNILIDRRQRVRVADFGLAKRTWDEDTSVGSFLGTPYYISPEQVRNQQVDWRSDLYSLGVVLYEMLTGERPFRGALFQIFDSHMNARFPPLSERTPEVPKEVEGLVEWLSRKKPEGRPASYRELLTNLEKTRGSAPEPSSLQAGTETAPPPTASSVLRSPALALSRWRPQTWVLGALVVIALAVAAGWLWRSATFRDPAPAAPAVGIRRSIAVLGFKNLSGREDDAWYSTAFAEMLSAELGVSEKLRTIAGENVARAKLELALRDGEILAGDTLDKLRSLLGAELLVVGSYLAVPGDPGQLRLDLSLQDTTVGDTIETFSLTGSQEGFLDLVALTGDKLRWRLEADDVSLAVTGQARAGLPRDPETLRLYSQGLERFRTHDFSTARTLLAEAIDQEPGQALLHAALAEVWSALGNDRKAHEEAARAFELSGDLLERDRVFVEGRKYEMARQWDEAIRSYRTLYGHFPDHVDCGLRLAHALSSAGRGEEAIEVIEALKKLPQPSSDDARILIAEAEAAESYSNFERARAAGTAAIAKGEAHGSRLLIASGRLFEGLALVRLGQHREGAAALDSARELFAAAGDRIGEAHAINRIANVAYEAGDFPEARRIFLQALELSREVGNQRAQAMAVNNIASTLLMEGELAAARPYLEETLTLGQQLDDQRIHWGAQVSLAGLALRRGDLTAARTAGHEGIAIARASNDRYGIYTGLNALGEAALMAGEIDTAAKHLREGLEWAQRLGDRHNMASILRVLGNLAMVTADLDGARQRHESALELLEELGGRVEAAENRVARALISVEEGRPDAYLDEVEASIAFFRRQGMENREAFACAVQASAYLALGRTEDARRACGRAEELLASCQNVAVRLFTSVQIARTDAVDGEIDKAMASLEATIAEAVRREFVLAEYEARLALAEIKQAQDSGGAGNALLQLADEARARKLHLIARKAAAAAGLPNP
ncbi:MAG: protein kinase [bacterium]|nr:protein kinase [bacterium]